MILVRMREYDSAHPPVAQVRDVREDEVDAEVLVAREREARVDDHDVVAVLVDGHVLADFAEPAERHDPEDPVHRE